MSHNRRNTEEEKNVFLNSIKQKEQRKGKQISLVCVLGQVRGCIYTDFKITVLNRLCLFCFI